MVQDWTSYGSQDRPFCLSALRLTSVEPHRRRIIGAGQRADGARCRARTNAMDGRNRRKPAVADRDLGRLNWAETGPTRLASGRTGVGAKAALPLRARSRLHRPEADLPNN